MSHSPSLYNVCVADAAALTALSSTFNNGDVAYVQSTGLYYTFVSSGGFTPAGCITSTGGYFSPIATPLTVGVQVAGGAATLSYVSNRSYVGLVSVTYDGVGLYTVQITGATAIAGAQVTANSATTKTVAADIVGDRVIVSASADTSFTLSLFGVR